MRVFPDIMPVLASLSGEKQLDNHDKKSYNTPEILTIRRNQMKKVLFIILSAAFLVTACQDKRLSEMPWHEGNFAAAQNAVEQGDQIMMFFETEW